jgi:hypothetical protein
VDDGRQVLQRLRRIEALEQAGAPGEELLGELRLLLTEAEAWARREGGEAGEAAVGKLRAALARDMIAV